MSLPSLPICFPARTKPSPTDLWRCLGLSARPATTTAIPATAALPARTAFGVFWTSVATVAETPERDCLRERFARVAADERVRPTAFEDERLFPVALLGERLAAVAFEGERFRAAALVAGRLRPADPVFFARLLAAVLDVPLDDFVVRCAIALLRSRCRRSNRFTQVITR
jgi:hypothetical protein